jgi:uncharacterized protein (DUF4213/DUF364 family)
MIRTGPWALHDTLIEAVDDRAVIEGGFQTRYWIMLQTDQPGGTGLAHLLSGWRPPLSGAVEGLAGRRVKDLARLAASWNFYEAALGLAAINASLNAERLRSLDSEGPVFGNAIENLRQRARGKTVGVIGRFPRLEALEGAAARLMVFERRPSEGDYPDPAAEFLLPECELVLVTGTTVINKTIPRLLELSRNAEVHLVGPSVPLCLDLFGLGLAGLAGSLVPDYRALSGALSIGNIGDPEFDRNLTRRVHYLAGGRG